MHKMSTWLFWSLRFHTKKDNNSQFSITKVRVYKIKIKWSNIVKHRFWDHLSAQSLLIFILSPLLHSQPKQRPHTHKHSHTYTHIKKCHFTHLHQNTHTCMHMRMRTPTQMHTYVHVFARARTQTHTPHTHLHTHTHTHLTIHDLTYHVSPY